MSKQPSKEELARYADILKMCGVDTSRLSAAEITEGAELVRRITQCDRVPGAGKRRGPAVEALRAFRAAKGV